MTNWTSPAEIQKDSKVWSCFVLALCGVATWDVLTTFWFDWQIITGKRKWKWPMALYFVARICLLLHVWLLSIDLNAIYEIPCQSIIYALKVPDMIGTTCSSAILALRTYAVWHQDKRVGIPLVIGTVGQLAAWSQTLRFSISKWDPVKKICARLQTAPPAIMIVTFSYTIVLDFFILSLCAYKLAYRSRGEGIGALLLRDGVIYFIAVFLGNLLETIFVAARLSPIMNLMALPFALVVSVIASTTVFRHVFTHYDAFHSGPSSGGNNNDGKVSSLHIQTPGVSARVAGSGGRFGFGRPGRSNNHFTLTDFKSEPGQTTELPVNITQTIDIERDPHKVTDTWDYDRQATREQAVVTLEDRDLDGDSFASRKGSVL